MQRLFNMVCRSTPWNLVPSKILRLGGGFYVVPRYGVVAIFRLLLYFFVSVPRVSSLIKLVVLLVNFFNHLF